MRGVSGTGKTELATRLAARFSCVWLASDYLRKQATGGDLSRALGPESYSAGARLAVYRRLHRAAGWYLKRGFPVVLDATYLDPAMRATAARLARRHGVPLVALTLHADPDVLKERLERRVPGASDATWEVARLQLDRYGDAPFKGAHEIRLAAGAPVAAIFEQARHELAPLLGIPSRSS